MVTSEAELDFAMKNSMDTVAASFHQKAWIRLFRFEHSSRDPSLDLLFRSLQATQERPQHAHSIKGLSRLPSIAELRKFCVLHLLHKAQRKKDRPRLLAGLTRPFEGPSARRVLL